MQRGPCPVKILPEFANLLEYLQFSDVNSMYECGEIGGEADLDDTSLSSRASSRIFDSDQIYSAESMHGM